MLAALVVLLATTLPDPAATPPSDQAPVDPVAATARPSAPAAGTGVEDDEGPLPPWPEEAAAAEAAKAGGGPAPPPQAATSGPPGPTAVDVDVDRQEPITLLFNYGAYYSSVGLYLPLTGKALPSLGERTEAQIYGTLLTHPRPRFAVFELSVYPVPCAGLLVHGWDTVYREAQVTPERNLVRVLTAGYEEPVAGSIFLGNVVRFDVPGRSDVHGRGYLGLVVSGGPWHIRDNETVADPWLELELKLKGDRTSDQAKLSWSFRGGAKLHGNPDVTDVLFIGLRRSRVDYLPGHWLFANSGIEYRFDLSMQGKPLRHRLLVDKKLPLGKSKVALVLGVGLLWESAAAYSGALGGSSHLQWMVQPNVVF